MASFNDLTTYNMHHNTAYTHLENNHLQQGECRTILSKSSHSTDNYVCFVRKSYSHFKKLESASTQQQKFRNIYFGRKTGNAISRERESYASISSAEGSPSSTSFSSTSFSTDLSLALRIIGSAGRIRFRKMAITVPTQ